MINNFLEDILKILRGKNGTVFLIILAVFGVMFFLNILPALFKFAVFAAILFVIFKFFQKK